MEPESPLQILDNDYRLKEKIKNIIKKYDVGTRFASIPLQKASVLLPLFIKEGKINLLFTVRSMELKTMPGDVCFPGGRREQTDRDDIQTALREAKEEIGLCPEQVEIIGRLIPCMSVSPRYLITPVVAVVEEPFQACPDPNEVADVFLVPLDFFLSSDQYSILNVNVPRTGIHKIHAFHYEDKQKKKIYKIWGLTAHLALLLAVILLEKAPSFDYDLQNVLLSAENALLSSYSRM
ncbi:peroxisomal coenzyme A diphosphatase NUDT7 [Xenopus laevis]|uniref:Peroxisomal coenzyme A diphosphatase NUDT7 n=2 Tax=Xenopus laevis TaxID=8355 RepID=A0A1L8GKQ6_XENLA|nr:peroxisomal coenzyme A diphosphatase NUDT7 [Xenopus laevis]XP_018113377.1 peroxisomal coenzyme A diphosphatase NUDT7 [Xenopus laevis]XP_041446091.1 peroxisomal coenzyme A diphosphatase NUDT7 [Xenopus laevis]OCT84427.1 hypothetical protein XELAEV_18022580mg [Xenopus laevis]